MLSKKKLWERQVQEWPGSVRLSVHDVYLWCDEGKSIEERLNRYMQMCMAMQYPSVVFYRIKSTPWRGFRFGLNGGEYMSMYEVNRGGEDE